MSQIAEMPTMVTTSDPAEMAKTPFRIPNPLRAGVVSLLATIAVVGGAMAGLNVIVNREIDSYYGKRIAALGQPGTDPAYAVARAAAAQEAAAETATVSAN